jgi:hypothetical protein
VSFAAITLCVASQRVMPKVSVHFVIDSVRKLLHTPSYVSGTRHEGVAAYAYGIRVTTQEHSGETL